uniref:Integrase catalytic domain-containing protein n=1 Tax=Aegilops tauschii subsp. strangulata TaxID=200361 RepID=A0A452XXJ4_AEGTS
MQCDNGGEFLNSSLRSSLSAHGTSLRLSCPHTSPQNGKAERAIRSINDIIRTLLVQAHMPPKFWVEALHTSTYLLNVRPSRAIQHNTPHFMLYGTHPSTFGCLCYPNLYATTPHKLSPRSTPCVLLGLPLEHKGYRCLDLLTRKVITSRHVVFDELTFPFAQ